MSLKSKLKNLIDNQSYTKLEEAYVIAREDESKQATADRVLRKIVEENEYVEPETYITKKGSEAIKGYQNKRKRSETFNKKGELKPIDSRNTKEKYQKPLFPYKQY